MLTRRSPPTSSSARPGVGFPTVDGQQSASAAGQQIVAASTAIIDTGISEAAREEPDWRSQYIRHFWEITRLSAQQHAVQISSDGLAAVRRMATYQREGAATGLAEAMAQPRPDYLHGWTMPPTEDFRTTTLQVPYRGQLLQGDELRAQLDRWAESGTAEPSCIAALHSVVDNPGWLDLRDLTFVVLGAGSELGPYPSLLQWGANVVAIDLPGEVQWNRLVEVARGAPGTLTVPLRHPVGRRSDEIEVCADAGADVVTDAPEIAHWLAEMTGPFILGDYVYAPGSAHLRSSVAIDTILESLVAKRPDVGLAYLATPTDCYAVPSAVVDFSRAATPSNKALMNAARALSGGRLYRPNYPTVETTSDGLRFGLADALIGPQGPSYALAKRIQRWRAHLARSHGTFVSINVAPATRTQSVTRNRLLASAYHGAHHFGLEVFEPATSRTLMAALLVQNLRNPRSPAHPDVELEHHYELFVDGAFHGGMWRSAFAPRSVLGIAVAVGLLPG